MINPNFKYSVIIGSAFLVVIIASIVSSFFVYREVQDIQSTHHHHQVQPLLFMQQYEYELLRTATTFSEAYPIPDNNESQQIFSNWLNVLWSRSESIDEGPVGVVLVTNGFDLEHLKQSLKRIDQQLNQTQRVTIESYKAVKKILAGLIEAAHAYQQHRNLLYREIYLERQIKVMEYFRSNFLLQMLTLILGFFVALYLARTNKKLLGFGIKLEELVGTRTKSLSITNNKLKDEIEERRLTEVRLLESQSQIEIAKQKAENRMNFDPLTALASRTLFIDRFEQALIRSRSNSTQVALLFLDLDRFKNVNDTLGHSMGDELLKMTAQRLNSVLREGDTAARFGGDEFTLILPDIKQVSSIEYVISRILDELGKPYNLAGNSTVVSASIGITVFPKDGDAAETLLRKADSAMYKAKENGRNNYQFFTEQMDAAAHARLALESELHKEIEKPQFELYYQPIINTSNGLIVGAEALIRWPHETLGMISPEVFIPIAEDIDLILPIGEWVLYRACRDAKHWQNSAGKPLTITVNMSSRQFQKQNIPQLVSKVLDVTGLAAERLVLEITERLLIEDNQSTLSQFEELRSIGVGLAIDDFGTGFSSLSYLNKLPISILKIDRSFIQGINEHNSSLELVKTIISMASSLNLRVIAEGVETRQQGAILSANQCVLCQGYFFSKPLALADFERYLQQEGQHIDNISKVE